MGWILYIFSPQIDITFEWLDWFRWSEYRWKNFDDYYSPPPPIHSVQILSYVFFLCTIQDLFNDMLAGHLEQLSECIDLYEREWYHTIPTLDKIISMMISLKFNSIAFILKYFKKSLRFFFSLWHSNVS